MISIFAIISLASCSNDTSDTSDIPDTSNSSAASESSHVSEESSLSSSISLFSESPYYIDYTSVGTGICRVDAILVDSQYDGDIHIEIPAESPSGEKVIAISSSAFHNNQFSKSVPSYLLEEDFENLLKQIEDNASDGKSAATFQAYYVKIDLSDPKWIDETKEEFLASYPWAKNCVFYRLEPIMSELDLQRLCDIIETYTDYEYDLDQAEKFLSYTPNEQKDDFAALFYAPLYVDYSKITEITVPESVIYVNQAAFCGFDKLEKINGLAENCLINYTVADERGYEEMQYALIADEAIFEGNSKCFADFQQALEHSSLRAPTTVEPVPTYEEVDHTAFSLKGFYRYIEDKYYRSAFHYLNEFNIAEKQ